jgi:hypothetical protein
MIIILTKYQLLKGKKEPWVYISKIPTERKNHGYIYISRIPTVQRKERTTGIYISPEYQLFKGKKELWVYIYLQNTNCSKERKNHGYVSPGKENNEYISGQGLVFNGQIQPAVGCD